jgi:hypothetical protein
VVILITTSLLAYSRVLIEKLIVIQLLSMVVGVKLGLLHIWKKLRLSNTVGPRREEAAEYWRKMFSEELLYLNCLPC